MASSGHARPLPRDARTVALIASSMGIQEVETSALVQLLDFCHRYTYDVLQDAMVYADHAASGSAGRSGAPTAVSLDDVQLAVQSRVNYSFTPAPSKEMQLALATAVNSEPLPMIGEGYGIRLPPRSQRLTATSFNLVPNAPPLHDDLDDPDEAQPEPEPRSVAAAQVKLERPPSAGASATAAGRTLEEESDYDEVDEPMVPASEPAPAPAPPSASASASASAPASAPAPGPTAVVAAPSQEARGVKRQLEEDDDYD